MGGVAAASLQNGTLGFFKIIAATKKEKAKVSKEKKTKDFELKPSIIPV
jgi:hypothetical protein